MRRPRARNPGGNLETIVLAMLHLEKLGKPSPAMIVACVALVFAVGGTSHAIVKSDSVRICAKRSTGALRAAKKCKRSEQSFSVLTSDAAANLRGPAGDRGPAGTQGLPGSTRGEFASLASGVTSATTYQDLGGPSVQITTGDVGDGSGLIELAASTNADSTGGGNGEIGLFEDGNLLNIHRCNDDSALIGTNSPSISVTTPFGCGHQVSPDHPVSPAVLLIRVTPGTHTYSLRFKTVTGGTTSIFQNVRLWARAAS